MGTPVVNPAERSFLPMGPQNRAMGDIPGLDDAVASLFGRAPAIVRQRSERELAIYKDDRKLAEVVRDTHKRCFEGRLIYERNWWRNLLYTLGRQWIVYNTQRGQWVDKRLPRHIPRPVDNLVASGVDAIRAVFASVQLATLARPIGDNPEAMMTAETADKLMPVIASEHDIQSKEREGDFWLVECGNVIYHPWWDARAENAITMVPFERCLTCMEVSDPTEIEAMQGACPKCGGRSFINATDQQGQLVQKTIRHGGGRTDVLSPFEVACNTQGQTSMEDADELTRIRWRTKEYGQRHYPAAIAKRISWEKVTPERSLQLMKSLASQSEISSGPLSGFGSEMTYGEGITEYEIWKKPSREFPRGLVVRAVGGPGDFRIIREDQEQLPGPLPHWNAEGKAIWPWIHVPYQPFGGRFWGRSPLDTSIQIQDVVNRTDSLIELAMSRTANPIWLEPKGAEVKKFTGEPGIVVKYTPVLLGTGSSKPERIEGSTIPAYVLRYREMKVQSFNEQLGTTDPFKGGKPPGVEAFSAMQLLVERSQTRFTIPLEERGRGRQRWSMVTLELERLYGPAERKYAVMGPNGAWTFEAFKHSSLTGDIELLIEDGSHQPKTNLGLRAAIQQLDAMGVLPKDDPDVVYTILKALGSTNLLPRLDVGIKAALREQEQFQRWVAGPGSQPAPVDPMLLEQAQQTGEMPPTQYLQPLPFAVEKWHDHQIHIAQHKKWANSDLAIRIFMARPDLKQLWAQHLTEHEMAEANDAMFEAMIGGGGALPAGPGGAGAAQTMTNSNRESGNPADVPSGNRESAQRRGPE
jgi:hypothetical protein